MGPRFLLYALSIREIYIDCTLRTFDDDCIDGLRDLESCWMVHPTVYHAWARIPVDGKLFPSAEIISVEWGPDASSLMRAFAGTSLKTVTLGLAKHAMGTEIHLGQELKDIRGFFPYVNDMNLELDIDQPLSSDSSPNSLKTTMESWTSLTTLQISGAISERTFIVAAANLPNLHTLRVRSAVLFGPGEALPFCALREVILTNWTISSGAAFLSRISSSSLRAFSLSFNPRPSCPPSAYAVLLSQLARHPQLHRIDISSYSRTIDSVYRPPPVDLGQLLTPLLRNPNLRCVELTMGFSAPDLDDEALVYALSKAWPQLTHIGISLPRRGLTISFSTLQHLIHICPNLESVHLSVDLLSPLPPVLTTASLSNAIDSLHLIAHDDVPDSFKVQEVIAFLRELCPKLAHISGHGVRGAKKKRVDLPQVAHIHESLQQGYA